jgi:hypothetical protein
MFLSHNHIFGTPDDDTNLLSGFGARGDYQPTAQSTEGASPPSFPTHPYGARSGVRTFLLTVPNKLDIYYRDGILLVLARYLPP